MSEPQNTPSSPHPTGDSTGPRLAAATDAAPVSATNSAAQRAGKESEFGTRLKIVTVAPRASYPDGELAPGARDAYLGATVDGRYKVEAVLGEGGMGVVYQCSHTIIGKKVAMKVLRADLARDEEVTERFLNEARAASTIGNPHIIDISDFGQFADGATYFVMEFLSGVPLASVLESKLPVSLPRTLHIALQLAEGLAAAHAANIVHRDLKPDNVFLITRGGEKDFVKILDFGIAKVATTAEGRLTRAGTVFGTPHYMSPEQASGAPIDHRGDIYSLGVILYELTSGTVPFDSDNFMAILSQHMYKAPLPLRALPHLQNVPPGLEAIILKCLSKRPDDRYQSMQELSADLLRLRSGEIPSAVSEMMARSNGFNVPPDYFDHSHRIALQSVPPPAAPAGATRSRGKWLVGGAIVAALVAGVAFALHDGRAKPTAHAELAAAETRAEAHAAMAAPAPPELKQVVLAVEPLGAHVFRGSEDLGTSPVMLSLKPGEVAVIDVRQSGYVPRRLTLDGNEARQVIQLERTPTAASAHPDSRARARVPAPAPTHRPSTTASGSNGNSEIINPWGTGPAK